MGEVTLMLQMKTAAASRGVVRSGTARVVPLLGARSARAWTALRSFAVPSALGRLAFNQIPPLASPCRVAAPGVRSMSSLPPHMELAMPALSPTMTAGNIAKWMVKPGDKVSPGDHLCDVETDKATMGWEAQEEGYIAKILVEDGTNDVPVGDVVLVMCDEAADVAAFADFKPSPSAAAPAPAARRRQRRQHRLLRRLCRLLPLHLLSTRKL